MIAKYIKNVSGSTGSWGGQQLDHNQYYRLSGIELIDWALDTKIITSILAGEVIAAKSDDGLNDIASGAASLRYIQAISPSTLILDSNDIVSVEASSTILKFKDSSVAAPVSLSDLGGTYSDSVNASSTISTSSGTFSNIDSMSITPPAGKYIVMFQADISTTNDGAGEVRISADGSAVSGSLRQIAGDAITLLGATVDFRTSVASMGVTTVNGSQAIAAQYRSVSNTVTMRTRILTIIRTY